jgi:hypothetical protein
MDVEMLISYLGLGLPLSSYCCPFYYGLCEEQVVALLLVLIPTVLLLVLMFLLWWSWGWCRKFHYMPGNEISFACAGSCPCFTIVPGPWFCIYMDINFMICISDFFCPTPWLTSTLSPVHHDEHACHGLTWLWCGVALPRHTLAHHVFVMLAKVR